MNYEGITVNRFKLILFAIAASQMHANLSQDSSAKDTILNVHDSFYRAHSIVSASARGRKPRIRASAGNCENCWLAQHTKIDIHTGQELRRHLTRAANTHNESNLDWPHALSYPTLHQKSEKMNSCKL
jgi:hypothetical protein